MHICSRKVFGPDNHKMTFRDAGVSQKWRLINAYFCIFRRLGHIAYAVAYFNRKLHISAIIEDFQKKYLGFSFLIEIF